MLSSRVPSQPKILPVAALFPAARAVAIGLSRPTRAGGRSRLGRRTLEPANLAAVSGRCAPGAERAELERPEPDPHQLGDGMADGLAHPPHLALAALADRDLHQVGRQPPRPAGAVGPSSSSTPARSARSARSDTGGRRDPGAVALLDAEPGMGEPVRERAVVGEQDQAGGVDVEPPDRVEPPRSADERDDRRAALGIGRGGDDPGRLVQRDDDALGDRRAPARRRPSPGASAATSRGEVE